MRKTLTCADCGKPMQNQRTSRPQGEARCHGCRRANTAPRKRMPDTRKREPYGSKSGYCAECGKLMWRGRTSLPKGEARCQPCRRMNPKMMDLSKRKVYTQTCKHCGVEYIRRAPNKGWCSPKCYGESRVVRAEGDPHMLRHRRESASPGLTKNGRGKLRNKWRRQQRECVYCGATADTLDHVLPLVRGGTNYEGNLAPACKRCNSSKSGRTVIEWRTGRVLPRAIGSPNWEPKPKPVAKIKPQRQPHPCPMCETLTLRLKYCSKECSVERERRYLRDKYRAKHGLTVDSSLPTSKWAA